MVLNLVVNALDSMDEGGTLTIDLRQWNGMAEMVFRDTGCGMTPESAGKHLRAVLHAKPHRQGHGPGSVDQPSHHHQHSGEIEASSAGPNQGSTFTVRLPLQPPVDQGGPRDQEAEMDSPEALFRRRQAA